MRAILFDMDGVLYNSDEPIPGARETLAWVRAQNIPHLFVTNTSSRGRAFLLAKLVTFGIPALTEEILTPPAAAAEWLRTRANGPAALFVREKTRGEFAGIETLPHDAETGARYVVVGDLAENWDFQTLNRAFRLLRAEPESTLIALGMTKFWQAPDGLQLDVGPFIAALEHAAGKQALVFGKPSPVFFQMAAESLRLPAHEIAMIGDDIEIDVAGAQRAGMKGILVRTGKFRASDLERGLKPDAILGSIADLPARWPFR